MQGGSFRYWPSGPGCCAFWLIVRSSCRLEVNTLFLDGTEPSFYWHVRKGILGTVQDRKGEKIVHRK